MSRRAFVAASSLAVIAILAVSGAFVGRYLAFLLVTFYINVILAVSLYALLRTGVFSMAHAALMALGAYAAFITISRLHIPFELALLSGGIVAAVIGSLVCIPMLRLKALYFAVGTILLVAIVRNVLVWQDGLTGGPQGMTMAGIPTFFGVKFTEMNAQYFLLGLAALVVFFVHRLLGSQYGFICQASGENEALASSIGIRGDSFKLSMFALTAFIAGVVGGLQGSLISYIDPDAFTFHVSVMIFVYILVGGRASIAGPVSGAAIMTFLNEPLRGLAGLQSLAYGVALLAAIVFMPDGLLGLPVSRLATFWKRSSKNRGEDTKEASPDEALVV